jgi:hypothetical protein
MPFSRNTSGLRKKRTGFILLMAVMAVVILTAFPFSRQSFTRNASPRYSRDRAQAVANSKIKTPDNFKFRIRPAAATPASFAAVADAYVSSAATTSNFGTATDLRSQRSTLESYLRFDLSSLTNESVVSAKLRLTGSLNDISGTNIVTQVFSVSNTSWSETGILWSNKPSSGSTALASVTVVDNVAQLYEWDVTAFVKAELNAERHLISLALKNPSNSTPYAIFSSRESSTNQPELLVTTTTPPVVSITNPPSGASFLAPASITINADATDADDISKVEFLQGSTVLSTDITFPYSFTWNNVAVGNYTLTARATDGVGGTATSNPISVSVVATFPPTVSITNPISGSVFPAPGNVNIDVEATDSDGVLKVDFYQGNTLLGTDNTFPYSFAWTGMPACTFFLTAKATDSLGATATSAPVMVKVTGGTIGESTPPNFKIAFVADQGLGPLSAATLNLVASEGAQALVIPGDLDYADDPAAWEAQLNSTVGANFPVFTVAGNHDEDAWHGPTGYQKTIEARFNRLGIPWCGSCGVQQSFHYKGIFFVFTTPGLDPLVDLGNNDTYIREQLAADHSVWSISSWHKNMHLMQAGGKDDETGWEVYEESRAGGAIIANGHEHSYFRTHLLSSMMNQTVTSTANTMTLTKGNSFVFVSGLGGQSRREQEVTGPWVARIYATPCLPGDTICQPNAVEGVMFAVFNVGGQQNKANFYFKDVNGQIIDSFTVISQVDMPFIDSISPSEAGAAGPGLTVTVNGNGFISSSVVQVNGNSRPTSYLSSTQVIAQLSAADIQHGGVLPLKVVNAVTGGGVSNEVNLTLTAEPNPVPELTAIAPASSTVGSPNLTLTVTGTNFVFNSIARLNGIDRPTTFVNNTELTVLIPAADMASTGTFPVTIFNPAPGGGLSSAADFTVNNPTPTLANLSPANKTAGAATFTLTVNGSGFVTGSVARWNGNDLTTTFVSGNALTADISAADIVSAGTFPITVFNPAPGGGLSSSATFTVNNPAPVLETMSPSIRTTGDATFTLTVNGNGFVNSSVIRWNGFDRSTTFVSSNALTAEISAADIDSAGTFPITVFNPTPGGGLSSAADFTVSNPMPVLSGLSPTSKTVGDGPFSLTVNGSGFAHDSLVRWNGIDRSTIFVNSTELSAEITDADIQTAGIFSITVFTSGPGGGTTGPLAFTVNNPLAELSGISPNSAVAGAPGFTLSLSGNNFFEGVRVRWNGSDRPTLVVNSSQLTAEITAADIQTAGTANVSVFVPPPGGGVTAALEFMINNPGYEGDVAPRPNGSNNGTLSIADWVQIGRFASGLDIPNCNREFQRADVAPRNTLGGGSLTIADWVQAGRYASGLDPVVPAGGPNCSPAAAPLLRPIKEERPVAEAGTGAGRLVQINSMAIKPGKTGAVTITLEAQGNENALGFSLNFIPSQLSFVSASNGLDALEATLIVNADRAAAGGLEVSLALPPGQHFNKGRRQLVVLNFESLLSNDQSVIGFADRGDSLAVVDFNAEELAAEFVPLLSLGDVANNTNPIDEARFFVNQNYLDFLGRTPEPQGLDYWTSQIGMCGTDFSCIQHRRVAISAAFFMEQEFQQTGFAVHRFYKAAYGVPPRYVQFFMDRAALLGNPHPALSTADFARQFVGRSEFQRLYPAWLPAEAFVNKLFDHAGVERTMSERREAIDALSSGNKTRAQVLMELVESQSFKEREYNAAFVLMQYFGYLRRDPDQGGFEFWLNVLNNKEPGNYRGMVCSFITSSEYQRRFGQVVTRGNADCDQ